MPKSQDPSQFGSLPTADGIVTKRLGPGAPGTRRWLERYGKSLVCVRYRQDTSRLKLKATAGLVGFLFSLVAMSASQDDPEPQAVVTQLYRDFAWEAVIDTPELSDHALLEQPREILARYFDDRLTLLILKDRECAAKTHEICKLDFLPIWASQDPGAMELKVLATPRKNVISVKFRYPSNGETIELSYFMANTKIGWRISDIRYHGGRSLLVILGAKP